MAQSDVLRSCDCRGSPEGIPDHRDGERLRESEPARQSEPKEGADKPDDDGDQAAAEGISGEGLAQAPGDGRDEQ